MQTQPNFIYLKLMFQPQSEAFIRRSCVNNLPGVVTRKWNGRDSNLWPLDSKSNAQTNHYTTRQLVYSCVTMSLTQAVTCDTDTANTQQKSLVKHSYLRFHVLCVFTLKVIRAIFCNKQQQLYICQTNHRPLCNTIVTKVSLLRRHRNRRGYYKVRCVTATKLK